MIMLGIRKIDEILFVVEKFVEYKLNGSRVDLESLQLCRTNPEYDYDVLHFHTGC